MSEGNRLPKGWVEATIEQFCELENGDRSANYPSRSHFIASGVPFINAGHLNGGRICYEDMNFISTAKFASLLAGKVQKGDVLFCLRGSLGKVALVEKEGDGAIASSLVILRTSPQVSNRLVLMYLQSPLTASLIAKYDNGTAQPNLSARDLSRFTFPLPPLPEQHRIVEKVEELFSDLDAGVSSLERAKANLKRYRASVLKSAIEGRLTEEWRKEHPQGEDGQMLLDRILRERREKWEEGQLQKFQEKGKEPPKNWQSKYEEPSAPDTSELPELPEGWVWATVEHCSFVDVGFAFKSSEFADEGIRLLRGENMEPGALRWKDVRYWPTNKVDGYEHLLLSEGDIVLAMDRPLVSAGLKIARAKETDLPALLVQRMARLRVMTEVNTAFLFVTMQTQRFITHLLGEQQGTQLPHISGTSIQEFPIPLPPLAEQEQIVALVEERLSQIDSAEKTIDSELIRSKRLRQSILKRAFEGKLVPQNPKDEPASVLLERIRANREQEQPKKKAKRVKSQGTATGRAS